MRLGVLQQQDEVGHQGRALGALDLEFAAGGQARAGAQALGRLPDHVQRLGPPEGLDERLGLLPQPPEQEPLVADDEPAEDREADQQAARPDEGVGPLGPEEAHGEGARRGEERHREFGTELEEPRRRIVST